MKTAFRTITIAGMILLLATVGAFSARIKDIAKVSGVRQNQLVGYGLVVGLAGTGDGVRMTKQTVANMLEKMGVNVDIGDINVDNAAAVMVTANLNAFTKSGHTIDVVVSSIGDADSLQGGTLIMTPLKGADGRVYAVAQGPVSLGGWSAGRAGGRQSKGHPTVARISDGATVEREVPADFLGPRERIILNLNNPDFTTAANLSDKVNMRFGPGTAKAIDSSSIEVKVPDDLIDDVVPFMAEIEAIEVEQDQISKVVINERTGTIVMGGDVTITPVAVAHGTLTVTVKPDFEISQPDTPFGGGETVVAKRPNIEAEEKQVSFTRVSTSDIVDALNAMGVTPSDIIAILQALKVSGALQAEIVVM
ncbi:MAG TPA: flagellar basal body P-ring protein FlgI [bacterium]|nr:flagellar basal body P-ring protein FlgI [bacterium]